MLDVVKGHQSTQSFHRNRTIWMKVIRELYKQSASEAVGSETSRYLKHWVCLDILWTTLAFFYSYHINYIILTTYCFTKITSTFLSNQSQVNLS